jgi:hypothetical protein
MKPEPEGLKPELRTGLLELVHTLDSQGVRYALVGGLASGFRGRARFTEDIDLLLLVPQLKLPGVLEDLKARGFDLDVIETIREWNQNHTAVLRYHGVQIDWLKPVLPCLQHVIDRAAGEDWLGTTVRIASTEDLIVLKLLAFRPQDVLDIQGLLAANAGALDLELVRRELGDVLPDDDERIVQFEELVRDYYDKG